MTEINMTEINSALKEIRSEFEKKSVNQEKVAKLEAILEKQEDANQELVKKINEEKASREDLEAKYNDIEAELKRGSLVGEKKEEASKELKSFEKFLSLGKEYSRVLEEKTLRTDVTTSGGYLAPAEYVNEIIKDITEISPVRQVARIIRTSAKEIEIPKRSGLVSGGWVGEIEAASSSNSTFAMEKISLNKMMVYSDVSIEMLQDSAFNMRQEISSDVAEDFARIEGAAFVSGNGVKKPEGLLSNENVEVTTSGNASALTADSLFEIQGSINGQAYDLSFMLNRKTLYQHVATLKDNNGQYLFQMGLGSLPNRIAGLNYVLANDLPDVAANAKPIIVGDFRKAYYIVDSTDVTVLEDPYTQGINGVRRFVFYKRVGGQVVLPEAIKILKIAA